MSRTGVLKKPFTWEFDGFFPNAYRPRLLKDGFSAVDSWQRGIPMYQNYCLDPSHLDTISGLQHALRYGVTAQEIRESGLVEHVLAFVDIEDPKNYYFDTDAPAEDDKPIVRMSMEASGRLEVALVSWTGWVK